MRPAETEERISLNDYCIRCEYENEIPDAKARLQTKILEDFPDHFASKCRPAVRQSIQKAWVDHIEARRRAIEQKMQPLNDGIKILDDFFNQ